ncbi:MAG: ATP-dependent DNA helicase PcrA [wastewater metagenome]|nr:ATP-dependent DNA helicase PcrA [Candidatus Loosdrechtia aerotolerans]
MPFLRDITENQREAITHIEGPLLVVAGAGSGKTRVITRRIGYLLSQGVNPYNILAITFTNKAANEMHERVRQFLRKEGLWVSTFHKMCSRVLRANIDRLGYTRDFTIYDSADQIGRIRSIMAELQLDTAQWKPRSIASSISYAKNKLIDPETFSSTASDYFYRTVAQVYSKYHTLLKTNNALDFDDLLIKTIELFKKHPDILESYQNKFKFILVDEYQDTNYAQYNITKMLADGHENICVTGDPDQSIYGWRGADIKNIMDFEKDYPNAKVVLLEQNYRSTKHILHAASGVIQHNRYRRKKDLWTENSEGEKVRAVHCEDEYREAEEITRTVRELVERGEKYSDIAIFYRTNAQSRVLEISLRNFGIPYIIVGGVAFYQRKEIKDILCYLRLCINPHDDAALERIINTPTRGIGSTTVKRVLDRARVQGISTFSALSQADSIQDIRGQAASSLKKFTDLIIRLQQSPKAPVEDIIKRVINETRYIEFLKESEERESKERIANVEELVNAAHEYDMNILDSNLQGFLEEVALVSDIDSMEDSTENVTLMTLHTAKGLEFPIVFIAGVEETLLPHAESNASDEEIEEERRLCYVGITRAMKKLYLTYTRRRTKFGQTNLCRRSRFLDEIPKEVLITIDKTNSEYFKHPDDISEEKDPPYYEPIFEPDPYDTNYHAYSETGKTNVSVRGAQTFSTGEMVRHPIFGVGRILEITGSNDKSCIKVRFNIGGIKNLMLAYAKLEKIG